MAGGNAPTPPPAKPFHKIGLWVAIVLTILPFLCCVLPLPWILSRPNVNPDLVPTAILQAVSVGCFPAIFVWGIYGTWVFTRNWEELKRIGARSFVLAVCFAPSLIGTHLLAKPVSSAFALPGPAIIALLFASSIWMKLLFGLLPILFTWFAVWGTWLAIVRWRRARAGTTSPHGKS